MRTKDIHIGDRLRVREWDDMKTEFGTREGFAGDEIIKCPFNFTEKMRHMCGQLFTVADIDEGELISEEGIEIDTTRLKNRWMISAEMLEPAEAEIPIAEAADLSELLAFLSDT